MDIQQKFLDPVQSVPMMQSLLGRDSEVKQDLLLGPKLLKSGEKKMGIMAYMEPQINMMKIKNGLFTGSSQVGTEENDQIFRYHS